MLPSRIFLDTSSRLHCPIASALRVRSVATDCQGELLAEQLRENFAGFTPARHSPPELQQ